MNKSAIFKKAYGCLAGQAIGDAMGATSEGLHYKAIKRKWGKITESNIGERGYGTTDDHALLEIVAKTIIRKGGRITAFDFADGVIDYMNMNMVHWNEQGMGLRLSGCIGEGEISPHVTGQRQVNTPGPTFACPPIAMVNACDPYGAAKDIYEVFSPWVDGFAQEAAIPVGAAIAEAFKMDSTLESIVEASMKYCGPKVAKHIEKAVNLAEKFDDVYEAAASQKMHQELCIDGEGFKLDKFLRMHTNYKTPEQVWEGLFKIGLNLPEDFDLGGHPIEMPAIAIAFFIIAKGDPMKAMSGAASFGRDCDGIAGIAGAIAGAWKGINTSMENAVHKVDELNKVNYKKTGEDYISINLLAEKMMKPILNAMEEKEEIASQIMKLKKV